MPTDHRPTPPIRPIRPIRPISREFGEMFVEYRQDAAFDSAVNRIREEYDKAKKKHPRFPLFQSSSLIAEEMGEFAQVLNDRNSGKLGRDEFYKRGMEEAAHTAVTAIRTMIAISADYRTSKGGRK